MDSYWTPSPSHAIWTLLDSLKDLPPAIELSKHPDSGLPGVNDDQPTPAKSLTFRETVASPCSRPVAASSPSTTESVRPFICAWARRMPHRSAIGLSTGRARSPNHAGKSRSSHSSNCVRRLLGGSSFDSKSDLCQSEDTRVKRAGVRLFQPLLYFWIWVIASPFQTLLIPGQILTVTAT
jgi:hypothetical protein